VGISQNQLRLKGREIRDIMGRDSEKEMRRYGEKEDYLSISFCCS